MAVLLAVSSLGLADVIYETEDPFGGIFGLWGADVCVDQSVGVRFTPGGNYTLDRVSIWFMSNDFTGQTHPLVEVTLRTDDDSTPGVSVPSDQILEAWVFNIAAVGWNPVLEVMDSTEHPPLQDGMHYWIVAESQAVCGDDGVWNFASFGLGFAAFSLGYGQAWQPGGSGAALTLIIEGTPVAPGDLDWDGDVDLDDYAVWVTCLAGPGVPGFGGCQHGDLDGDLDIDLRDFAVFQQAFTGPQ
ncbi:MAG: hypothetical protein ACYSUI_14180 [Planctomycetota bacterium]